MCPSRFTCFSKFKDELYIQLNSLVTLICDYNFDQEYKMRRVRMQSGERVIAGSNSNVIDSLDIWKID